MNIRLFTLLIVSALLFGCTSNYPLKPVDYSDLFCDGNSKVWIIKKMFVNKVDIAPHNLEFKEVLIFHESGVINYLPLKALGEKEPQKGRFYLDSEKKELSITFENEKWYFSLPILEEDKILMRPKKKGEAPFSLELKPLPEL